MQFLHLPRWKKLAAVLALMAICMPVFAQAAFQPGSIISDAEFTDAGSMTIADIQRFLDRRGGALGKLSVEDFNKVPKPAAQAIFEVAQLYAINPRVILVTLQKEQSLLTLTAPSQRGLDYAMGYGCPDSGGCSANAAGFYRQIDFATWQFRKYFTFPSQYTYKSGGTYTFRDLGNTRISTVTILNQATANLYNYTPHVYNGNFNFHRFYAEWFSKVYPDGSLLRIGKNGGIWLIQNGERRAMQNRAAFVTRFGDFKKVIEVTADVIELYPRGADIRLPNYSLVRTPDGHIYMLSGDEKRLIASDDVFRNLGFNPEEVTDVTMEDIAPYLDGVTISNASAYPAGALAQIKETGAIVWIEQGIWYPIVDRSILQSRFPNRKPTLKITSSELAKYERAASLTLRDGELVRTKGEGGVYVISNGLRRAIRSRQTFNRYGYNMKNVLTISPRVAEMHPVGTPLDDPA
jgi:hypothetical protein